MKIFSRIYDSTASEPVASRQNRTICGFLLRQACITLFAVLFTLMSGCVILGEGDEEDGEWLTENSHSFVGIWEKDNTGGVSIEFTETAWTARYNGSTYNSGTFKVRKRTETTVSAQLQVTQAGTGSAKVGDVGIATLSLNKNYLMTSGFSDGNMNGFYSNPELELVSSSFDGVITGKIEHNYYTDPAIDKVVAYVQVKVSDNHYEPQNFAEGTFRAGDFSISLPAAPQPKFLQEAEMAYSYFGSIENISDKNARLCKINHFAVSGSAGFNGMTFSYKNWEGNDMTTGIFVYTDRDISITGINRYQATSILLKKGWNIVYETNPHNYETEKRIVTTKAPDGLKWTFY